MLQLIATIKKELLLLLRDRGGLAIMFLMPMAMITIMALIQDAPFKDYQEMHIPLLLVNNDTGNIGKKIEQGLIDSKLFELTKQTISSEDLKSSIKKGNYEVGIFISDDATQLLMNNVNQFVTHQLADVGLTDKVVTDNDVTIKNNSIELFFAPDTKKSFKVSVLNSLKQATSKLETQSLLNAFKRELNSENKLMKSDTALSEFISVKETITTESSNESLQLNSVQHNVPAWTIFGIFFIVISMAGSIIKERDDGSYLRIMTMPGSYITVLVGKITAYLFITLIQALLMLMIGFYLLPLLGLPKLIIGNNIFGIILITVSTGLAATGMGVMVGSVFKTHQQSSTFGAVSIVILAALGGIWIPVYVMPESVQWLASFSPLYWSLNAYHQLFLSNAVFFDVLPSALKLLAFFVAMLALSIWKNKQE
jgi:ABC-2 type transport system permease protein